MLFFQKLFAIVLEILPDVLLLVSALVICLNLYLVLVPLEQLMYLYQLLRDGTNGVGVNFFAPISTGLSPAVDVFIWTSLYAIMVGVLFVIMVVGTGHRVTRRNILRIGGGYVVCSCLLVAVMTSLVELGIFVALPIGLVAIFEVGVVCLAIMYEPALWESGSDSTRAIIA